VFSLALSDAVTTSLIGAGLAIVTLFIGGLGWLGKKLWDLLDYFVKEALAFISRMALAQEQTNEHMGNIDTRISEVEHTVKTGLHEVRTGLNEQKTTSEKTNDQLGVIAKSVDHLTREYSRIDDDLRELKEKQ
jgi:septal ring factor EnvC (AmiA/AmiB activator)